jgi:hypothetical protein
MKSNKISQVKLYPSLQTPLKRKGFKKLCTILSGNKLLSAVFMLGCKSKSDSFKTYLVALFVQVPDLLSGKLVT